MSDGDESDYQPGQVVNGHVLSEDGTEWLSLSKPGPSKTVIAWSVAGAFTALVALGVLLAALAPWKTLTAGTTSPIHAAGSASPSPSGTWGPAATAWMRQASGAITEWQTAAKPIVAWYEKTGQYNYEESEWFKSEVTTMEDAEDRIFHLAAFPPDGVPESLASAMKALGKTLYAQDERLAGMTILLPTWAEKTTEEVRRNSYEQYQERRAKMEKRIERVWQLQAQYAPEGGSVPMPTFGD